METHPTVVIKFDVFGNQLIFPESIEKDKIIPIDKTEIKNEILKEIPDFKSDLKKLKDELVNSFNSLFSISKSYIGFKNRRLVSVSEGKDNNDVVIMKQVKKMLEDSIKENLRDKRSIDMEDINKKLMDYVTKKEMNEKIETLDSDIYEEINDLFMPVVKKDIDFLRDEINNKLLGYIKEDEINEKIKTVDLMTELINILKANGVILQS